MLTDVSIWSEWGIRQTSKVEMI
jgi:hypothetical protein